MAKVVTYGNTWSAINAAIGASIAGSESHLVTSFGHMGGIIANGLSLIDLGRFGVRGLGWLTNEFARRQSAMYGTSDLLLRTTPSTAELIFSDMLKFYGVVVHAGKTLTSVSKTGTTINSFTAGGTVFTADNFIDGTEEGDLATMAGVTMVWGRESAATYGEALAGFSPMEDSFAAFDCYSAPGVLLPGFSAYPALSAGDADLGIQSYGFRLCLTQNKENKRAWPKPAGYDPTLFEYLRRAIPVGLATWKPFGAGACLDRKHDMNADYGAPRQWGWPNGTPAERATIFQQIYKEEAGWLWFLANDSSIHPQVQDYVNSWGPPKDEFNDNSVSAAGWPNELYVREGRRMVGQYVMTQADTQTTITKTDAMSMDFYSIDIHNPQRLAVVRGGVAGYILDSLGRFPSADRQVIPFQRPLRCALPVTSECVNLGVVVACSMSHVAGGPMRIDIHKANFGSAIGFALGKSAVTATPINSLSVSALQADLDGFGQVRAYTPPA